MNFKEFIADNSEKAWLGVYFLVMVVVGGLLFLTLGEAWQQADIVRPLILSLNPLISVSLEQFSALVFGLYSGLLVLLVIDPKKRMQGLLLGFGTISGLIGLLSIGLFIPNIDFGSNMPLVLGGLVAGSILGGGRELVQVRTGDALEFRRAATLMFWLLTVIVVVGLLEHHINFPQVVEVASDSVAVVEPDQGVELETAGAAVNGVMAAIFIVTLRSFFQYDAAESFFIVGPRGSGKSLFLVGKYLAALDDAAGREEDTPMSPSGDLMELVSAVDSASEEAGWELGSTDPADVKDLQFNFVKGRVFPKNIHIGSLDYAGEYLSELPTALMGTEDEIDDSTLRRLVQRVRTANTLVLILDMERYHNNEPLGIEAYFDILNATDNTKVLLVATKCDILAEQFRDERGLEAHQYFDEFRDYVNETLVQNDQTVRTLVQDTGSTDIQPVYYQTTIKTSDDNTEERVPMRDRNGNVMTIGFDNLLEKMG